MGLRSGYKSVKVGVIGRMTDEGWWIIARGTGDSKLKLKVKYAGKVAPRKIALKSPINIHIKVVLDTLLKEVGFRISKAG